MFGFLKKKQQDVLVAASSSLYGSNLSIGDADVDLAVTLAYTDLLITAVDLPAVDRTARGMATGPVSQSTHDLALSVAMYYFTDPAYFETLEVVQLFSRLEVRHWLASGKVTPHLAQAFEECLDRAYASEPH